MSGHCSDIADKYGYGVVEHFVGHGVGVVFHSGPSVLHARKFSLSLLQRSSINPTSDDIVRFASAT
jgi:methionine aminopeptidase